jgi:uncharacterized membrane protein (DUF2068 family)
MVYWIIWFSKPALLWLRLPGALDFAVYANHRQGDFLTAVWLAVAALISAAGLWQRRDWGFLFTLLAGATTFTVGLSSLLFDLQNQLFVPLTAEAGLELILLIMMLVFGPLSILLVWRYRRRFIR